MNFFSEIYKRSICIYNNYFNYETLKKTSNLLMIPFFIYYNFFDKNIIKKYIFNLYFLYHIYQNKIFYINKFIDLCFELKFKISILFPTNKLFILKKVLLYTSLNKNYDITSYFNKKKITKINKLLILDIYSYLNILFENNDDIRLKIYFKYNNNNYIIYYSYNIQNNSIFEEANIEEANIEEANIEEANIEKANIEEANIEKANVEEENVEEENVEEANVEEANIEEANVEEANVEEANVEEANVEEENIEEANVEEENVEEENVEEENVEEENVEKANVEEENNNYSHYIPYPPYSTDIISNFRNDIILPMYTSNLKKKYFYSLFNIETKDILTIKLNDNDNNMLLQYFDMIKTPFNDFGILYNIPIKLIWVLVENNIDINNFSKFYLKFDSIYINDKTFELNDHEILLTNKDLNKFIISERMKEIINLKKKEDNKKNI